MHELGFVHRDVKPENVLVTSDGIVKVADFGISCRLSDKEQMARRCGSPGFAAPEVLLGKEYGIKVDTFSCGCLLHMIISGRRPFSGQDAEAVVRKTLDSQVNFRKSVLLERLSDDCKEFMQLLLEKDPVDRPTANETLSLMSWLTEFDLRSVQDDARSPQKIYASECGSSRYSSESTRAEHSSRRSTHSQPTQTHVAEQETDVIFSPLSALPTRPRRRRSCDSSAPECHPTLPTTLKPSQGPSRPHRFFNRLTAGKIPDPM